jgi:hypothetical protein
VSGYDPLGFWVDGIGLSWRFSIAAIILLVVIPSICGSIADKIRKRKRRDE